MSLTLDPAAARRMSSGRAGELDPRAVQRQFIPHVRPWEADDLARILVFQVVAAAVVAVSWWIVSGTGDLQKQMLWLRIGVAGVLLSGIANGVWLMRGRRLVGLARRVVLEAFEPVVSRPVASATTTSPTAAREFVAVPGTSRFHVGTCTLVRGKETVRGERSWHSAEGRSACEACCP